MYRCSSSYKTALAVAGCVALIGALAGCEPPESDAAPSEGDARSVEADAIPVETLTIQARDFVDSFEVPAGAEPYEKVTVSAEAGGRVLVAPFEEGEEVRAGSRLLRVDTELDSARIDLAESQLESAQREYDRTKKLVDKGLATPQQLDRAEDSLENARLSLEQSKIGASKGGVRSPVSGVILQKHVKKGEFASPGAPIATIIQYDKLKVVGQVPESRIRFVNVGDTVSVTFPAREATLQGEVTRRALSASPRTGTFAVEITVENPDLEILPGMSARVEIIKKIWDSAVVVPREAVLQGFSRSETMVLPTDDEVGNAELHVVELGPSAGADVVITSGLAAGDRLIVRGHRGLVDGALARQVRHFDSIEQMRSAGAGLELGEKNKKDKASDEATPQQSDGDDAAEGEGQ